VNSRNADRPIELMNKGWPRIAAGFSARVGAGR